MKTAGQDSWSGRFAARWLAVRRSTSFWQGNCVLVRDLPDKGGRYERRYARLIAEWVCY